MMRNLQLKIFADYFQFYLLDQDAKLDFSDSWNAETVENHLAIIPGGIAVGTERNTFVPVTIEIRESAPSCNFDECDMVNECCIEIPSGKLAVMGCTDTLPQAVRIELEAGTYRARICYRKLDSVSQNRLEGDDSYKIVLWKGDAIAPKVLKAK